MATLKDFFTGYSSTVPDMVNKYKLKHLVETGTGLGESLFFVCPHFEKSSSIEIEESNVLKARETAKKYKNVNIILGNSSVILDKLTQEHSEDNTLFWLDAHFPGSCFIHNDLGKEKDKDIRIPLEVEMRTICKNKDTSKDVFIIDDLRIYEDGNFGDGNWNQREELGGDGIDFIYELLGDTHIIERDYRYQGFVICLPK